MDPETNADGRDESGCRLFPISSQFADSGELERIHRFKGAARRKEREESRRRRTRKNKEQRPGALSRDLELWVGTYDWT